MSFVYHEFMPCSFFLRPKKVSEYRYNALLTRSTIVWIMSHHNRSSVISVNEHQNVWIIIALEYRSLKAIAIVFIDLE